MYGPVFSFYALRLIPTSEEDSGELVYEMFRYLTIYEEMLEFKQL